MFELEVVGMPGMHRTAFSGGEDKDEKWLCSLSEVH